VHPIQVSQWKKQLLEGARKLIMQLKKSQAIEETVERTRDDLLRWLTTEVGPAPIRRHQ